MLAPFWLPFGALLASFWRPFGSFSAPRDKKMPKRTPQGLLILTLQKAHKRKVKIRSKIAPKLNKIGAKLPLARHSRVDR